MKSNTKYFYLNIIVIFCATIWGLNSCAISPYHSIPVTSYQTVEVSGFVKKWKLENVFIGYSRLNPMMVASKGTIVFIGGLDINDNKVIAVDAITGELLWQRELTPSVISISSDIFVGSYSGATVQKLDIKTGLTLWKTNLPNRSVIHITVENKKVNVQTSGQSDKFFILDVDTGEVVKQKKNSESSIYLYLEENRFQQGISLSRLENIDNRTNGTVWQTEMKHNFSMPPLFPEAKILVHTELGEVYCIARKTGDIIWQAKNTAISNLAVSEDFVYFLAQNERLMEIDLQSGETRGFVQFNVDNFRTNNNAYIGSYYVAYDAQTETVFIQFGDSAQLFAFQVSEK